MKIEKRNWIPVLCLVFCMALPSALVVWAYVDLLFKAVPNMLTILGLGIVLVGLGAIAESRLEEHRKRAGIISSSMSQSSISSARK